VTRCGMDDPAIHIPRAGREVSFLRSVQTGSRVHSASCEIDNGRSYLGCNAAEASG